jgi:hypothetical protein
MVMNRSVAFLNGETTKYAIQNQVRPGKRPTNPGLCGIMSGMCDTTRATR